MAKNTNQFISNLKNCAAMFIVFLSATITMADLPLDYIRYSLNRTNELRYTRGEKQHLQCMSRFKFYTYADIGGTFNTAYSYNPFGELGITYNSFYVKKINSGFKEWNFKYNNIVDPLQRYIKIRPVGILGLKYTFNLNGNGPNYETKLDTMKYLEYDFGLGVATGIPERCGLLAFLTLYQNRSLNGTNSIISHPGTNEYAGLLDLTHVASLPGAIQKGINYVISCGGVIVGSIKIDATLNFFNGNFYTIEPTLGAGDAPYHRCRLTSISQKYTVMVWNNHIGITCVKGHYLDLINRAADIFYKDLTFEYGFRFHKNIGILGYHPYEKGGISISYERIF